MSFLSEVTAFVSGTDRKVNEVVRAAQRMLAADVIAGTPVDTGHARGNWQFSEGSPATGELNVFDPTGLLTLATCAVQIDAARVGGTDWFLANNVPYILPLEFGHSKQAPNGMARLAAARFEQNVERAARAAFP